MAPQAIDNEYDIVFAGGGTAACIIAARLANAAPDLKILLVESGPTTQGKNEHIQAGQYITHLLPTSKTMQFYQSKQSEDTANRPVIVPSGMCVGGGSSVNFMLYNRPAASDFDDWESKYNNSGWSSKELIPLLEKAETYQIEPEKPTHGSSGPLRVSYGGAQLPIGKEFIEVGSKVEKDRPKSDEGNAFNKESVNVFFPMPKWISKDGRRSDTAHYYLYPAQEKNKNLVVADGTRVKRVIFEGTKAVGLEYLRDKRVYPEADQTVHTVRARRLVVLSAGAMGSPLILERSGIGAKDVLEKADVKQLVDLPGVGKEYHDHAFYVTPYVAADEAETYDRLFRGEPAEWGKLLTQWATENGAGLMGSNGVDAAIKVRPREDELAELGPDFTERWNSFFANHPDRPLFWLSALAGLPADQSALPPLTYMSTGCFLGYPASFGHLHISSNDVYAAPDFDAGFLNNKADVAALRWGYKKGREIIRRMSMFRAALTPAHPQFPEGSKAACTEAGPVPLDAPKLEYSAEDDAAIDANLRYFVATTWHSLGTCPMKPREAGGVVDKNLNVYGVTGLKVADLSIAPNNVNCNTYSATIAIAEKAALIFAKELGIEGV